MSLFQPYYVTIDQGNIYKSEQINALEIGMSPRQVLHILGSPLVRDSFNENRWDYVYTVVTEDALEIKQHMMIAFSNDKVVSIKKIRLNPFE